jgi:hypothetical protein
MPPIIISDEQAKEFRDVLIRLAFKNKYLTSYEKELLGNMRWYDININSVKCLICLKEITLLVNAYYLSNKEVYKVRYHGYLHLKEKNLLPFI